jgi:hypothetical protein
VHYLSTHFDDCDSLSEKTKAKTRPAKGEADRTARRARAQAELQATQLEEERERAEKELARARMAELRAQVDEMAPGGDGAVARSGQGAAASGADDGP